MNISSCIPFYIKKEMFLLLCQYSPFMPENKIKLGLVQTKAFDNIDINLDKTAKFIHEASGKGADIVCLQELFATGYFAQTEDKQFFEFAEKVPGKITNFLSKAAKDNEVTLVGGSLFEKGEDNKYYNTSLVFNKDGEIITKYRKIHIPHDPNYYEQFYFSHGNLGFVQVKADNVVISPLICYDQWYPEAARANALKGVQIIFYPTAIGWFKEFQEEEPWSEKLWENTICGHASMNGIFVAAVNRVGKENNLIFWGRSFIADPFGQVVARASGSKEEVLIAEIDLDKIRKQKEWGFLKNRQPKNYSELVK